ncbi:HAD-IA family hydrolase [Corynebacterium liangguodongii]|uniref:HAD family hydrolase n=1 Tax=Corynebacterium liangguodongii TaxID=2079535 RepID=A0A2S0WH67_9CORY|nr:HAD-IA family hydrolase [Corynebacterium liangguodongii]AWB85113.1 HAD family hydrolase [Corynebacterium liangguodongii]PWB99967.1 HAD family hydrolase [Corynebacterium liangguodongii]
MRTTLLLDVDGTLIDSFPGIREGFLRGLDAVGYTHPAEEFIRRIPGPPMTETMASLGMDAAEVGRAMAAYDDYMQNGGWANFTVFAGVAELVAGWKGRGFELATATSKGEGYARLALERAGILPHIDFLGAAQERGPRKRKVDVIAHVLASVKPQRPLMVGDRLHDFHGAAHFGLPSVAVTWGYGAPEEYEEATYVARTARELEEIVNAF